MAKLRIVFREKRLADSEWQIEALCEGQETKIISGLTSKEDARDWLDGPRKIAWLRAQGLAK